LLALHWLGPKSLVSLDAHENLHLSDVRTNKELEMMSLSDVGLVYGSAQFKGLATGGNVSPALALAGTSACYSSVISSGSQLYVLGGRSLHVISARAWSDRISHLSQLQRWEEAIDLAIDGYRAAGDRYRRKIVARDRILQLMDDYMLATSRCPELNLEAVMRCLIEINET
jgi:vacuolar protein sorting-associated protein 8